MDAFYIFNSILGCLPKEITSKNIDSEFYVEDMLIHCITDNRNPNYSKNILTIGKCKYAYIFRDTTPTEKNTRKYIIKTEMEEMMDEVEDLQR